LAHQRGPDTVIRMTTTTLTDKVNACPELAALPLRPSAEERIAALTPVLATPGAIYTVPVVEVTTHQVVTIAGLHR
jgi:hypothetical protein